MLSKTFTLRGSLRQDHSIQGPFFSISPLILDGSGEEIAAALSCILAAMAGTTTEPRDPLPLLSGWAGRAQLSLQQGLRINKDLKSSSSADGGLESSEEKAWEVFASSLNLTLTSTSGADAASREEKTEVREEVCASLDLTTLRCSASPGLLISVDVVCLGVEMHGQLNKEEGEGQKEAAHASSPPPPLAVLTNFSMRSEENEQEYTFGSLNIMSDPSTTRAALALAAGFSHGDNNGNASSAPAAGVAVPQQTENSNLSSAEQQSTTKYGFDMVTFTLFPPTNDLQKTPAGSSSLLGVTGWLSQFSMESGPLSRRVSVNCLELSQCKLDGANNEILTLPSNKVIR
jgi:hypothetical protein